VAEWGKAGMVARAGVAVKLMHVNAGPWPAVMQLRQRQEPQT
jgi:hypothetical protein